MPRNIYIHIPFCKQKCKYCSFVSFPKLELKQDYINALKKEITNYYKNEKLKTIYFGGGTPSLLKISEMEQILSLLNFNTETEVTVEINPETINFEYLQSLKKIGVNRISIGCQTFDDKILCEIGRKHSSDDVVIAVKYAQKAGFDNINLDFIYGLPNQKIEDFSKDLEKAVSLEIQHISLYGLKIDEGCYFYKNPPKNLPDDDIQADMYLKAIEVLTGQEFEHYEISNFAKQGFQSQHNLNYWDNNSYYGFGCAAHGYVNGIRYSNNSNIDLYLANPLCHKTEHKVTQQERLEEEIFLGFRKLAGINVEKINENFGIDFRKKYASQVKEFVGNRYLLETNTGYRLSDTGILISNNILSEFLE